MKKTDQVLELARAAGVLRAKDLEMYGIPREYLVRLVQQGLLVRQSRGLYTLADQPMSPQHTLAQVAARIPDSVICLLSALSYHDLTTQQPFQVWLALPEKSRRPKLECPPLRVCLFSQSAFMAGVETHNIEGRQVKIYNPAKTVADCFKYRNKIGLDVALEALQDAWHKRRVSMQELEKYAEICRVSRVMRPYLETLVA